MASALRCTWTCSQQKRYPGSRHGIYRLPDHRRPGCARQRSKSVRRWAAQEMAWDQPRPDTIAGHWNAFYRFTRPHTMIGTLLSICSVSCMAMRGHMWSSTTTAALTIALVSALLANVSIVGLNQCYDIELDRINKPYLPLASGEWSLATGRIVVGVTGALAVMTAVASSSWPLMATVIVSLILGVVYSADVPFLRWKKYPVAAAACILAVRAVFVQLGFWSHMALAAGASSVQPDTRIIFMTGFMTFFSIVIALFKDIPDARGDELHDTNTATVRFGAARIFNICVCMLHAAYATAVAYMATTMTGMPRVVALLVQIALAAILQCRMMEVDVSKHSDVVSAYMFVWKLFYAQYLIFPFLS